MQQSRYVQVDPDAIRREKTVYTTSCCCCIPLRAGTIILLIINLIFSALPLIGIAESVTSENVEVQASAPLGYSIAMLVLNIIFSVIGLVGVFRYNTRMFQMYAYWLFASMCLLVLWKVIYYSSGLAHDEIERGCELIVDSNNNSPDVPDVKPPPQFGSVEACSSISYGLLWKFDLPATLVSLLISTYFAVCVLSYYHEMYNKEIDALNRELTVNDQAQLGVRVVYANQAPARETELMTQPSAPSQ